MSDNPLIGNLTNHELITMCENNEHVVNKVMVEEMCSRLESLNGQVSMWHTLAGATKNVNSRLIKELREFQNHLDEITGD